MAVICLREDLQVPWLCRLQSTLHWWDIEAQHYGSYLFSFFSCCYTWKVSNFRYYLCSLSLENTNKELKKKHSSLFMPLSTYKFKQIVKILTRSQNRHHQYNDSLDDCHTWSRDDLIRFSHWCHTGTAMISRLRVLLSLYTLVSLTV